jgi:hypothetical protein
MKRQMMMLACAATLTVCSCTKDPLKDMSDQESRIYITQRDSTVNFRGFNTFSIADSVAYIGSNQPATRFTAGDAHLLTR